MTRSPPPNYRDGCTLGPQRLGKVSHEDICNRHDEDWWNKRRPLEKLWADLKWAGRLVWRHKANFPWQIHAVLLAGLGLLFMLTLGWLYWAGILGPWQEYRDKLKT